MTAFIDEHRDAYGVEPKRRVLPIAPSTYHEHVAQRRDPSRMSARAQRDQALKPEVLRVFAENFGVYGVRKVWRQMNREGFGIARCTVERLMRDPGLQGVICGKPVRTTISDKAAPCPLDQINRQFHAPVPNMLWVSDFTYVATCAGFVYVAFVIDVYARYLVGWRVSRTAHASFVLDALEQAIHDRRPVHRSGLIHHSNPGSQYFSIKYAERLAKAGIEPSVGSVGDSYATPWPRRSTDSTKPRSAIVADLGGRSNPSNMPRSNGSTGSTTGDARADRQYPARKSSRTILRHAGRHPHGSITQAKWPPAVSGRVNWSALLSFMSPAAQTSGHPVPTRNKAAVLYRAGGNRSRRQRSSRISSK